MDTVRRQRCETCAFYQAGPSPCTGLCSNLEWQPTSGAKRFVRGRELGCYGGWGVEFWRPRTHFGENLPNGGKPNDPFARSPGGKSPAGGSVSRYGTVAGGRIVQLRCIDVRLEPDRVVDTNVSDEEPSREDVDRLLGFDHSN